MDIKSAKTQLQPDSHTKKRILLGQLGANGDCLNATTLARQIKHDYPECHLTWAVSSPCRGMIENNPFVDEIWEIPVASGEQMPVVWNRFEKDVQKRIRQGEFDEVFLTQIYPNNFQNYDGTTRPSVLRAYPKPITVPVQYILRLRDDEVKKVQNFAKQHQLLQGNPVILFECTSRSGQSFVTPSYALYAAQLLLSRVPDCRIVLSSHVKIPVLDERIIDGSVLTLRENAELTKYCVLFIGCSSGVTLTALTDWAKPLPMILLLKSSTSMYASIVHEFEYWGYNTNLILEMWDAPIEELLECICTALTEEFATARNRFHQEINIDFKYYLGYITNFLLEPNEQYDKLACSLLYAVERYGWHRQLKLFVQTELMPKLEDRQSWPVTDEDYTQLLQNIISKKSVSITKCKICQGKTKNFSRAEILGKYEINYFQCSNCGFVQTEEPYWLEEAYSKAIASGDVGLVSRNLRLSTVAKYLISNFFDHHGKFLDYGGGYGLLVRMMRDAGFDFYWSDKFCENIFAEGFEGSQIRENRVEIVTAFEVFEHLVDPSREIEELFCLSKNILFSTEVLPENNPKPHEWWYYGLFAGQHISIYTVKSLALIADKFNVNFYSDGAGLHLFTEKNLPSDLFEKLQKGELELANKESLLNRDYLRAIDRISNKKRHEHSQNSLLTDLETTTSFLLELNLKEINFIIFPDWTQAEEELGLELQQVIQKVATHPERDRITLLVDTTGISEEDANLLLSGVVMNLLMEEDIDVSESAEISLVGQLAPIQWEALRSRLQARIVLRYENEQAIAQTHLDNLPTFSLDQPLTP